MFDVLAKIWYNINIKTYREEEDNKVETTKTPFSSMEEALKLLGFEIEEENWTVYNSYAEQLKRMAEEDKNNS